MRLKFFELNKRETMFDKFLSLYFQPWTVEYKPWEDWVVSGEEWIGDVFILRTGHGQQLTDDSGTSSTYVLHHRITVLDIHVHEL